MRPMQVAIGLILAFVSALAVNWAYSLEHAAAGTLPPLSARRPIASVRALLQSRAWLIAFGLESAGWVVYLAALRLAPLALVQTVGASGIAVLAVIETRGRLGRLRTHEQVAVGAAVLGLALVGLSLAGTPQHDHPPAPGQAALWLAACGAAALLAAGAHRKVSGAAALGASAGFLFAAGDLSAKLVVFGGGWLIAALPLIVAYACGSLELQAAFQHGEALVAAGLATLATNAVPIAAGIVLLHQTLPGGAGRVVELSAFGLLVLSATLLSRPRGSSRATAG
jgi:hypothetical protein